MDRFDCVSLIAEHKELATKGLHAGTTGIILHNVVKRDMWLVMFFNGKSYGEFAAATVSGKDLEFIGKITADAKEQAEELIKAKNFLENEKFSPDKVKQYDLIEMTADKAVYTRSGIHKGMRGCVMSANKIRNKWEVIFSETKTGQDIAGINVDERHFNVVR